ncbi:sugar ABC transporter substrate-binding protein [Paenibacillus sp. PL2-23]|uniref:ABC transporter substrate-binding protein n=1 Tax=Paenibacillus sp. PL2-23 TaxID=2100729 RepID=UPI0030FC5529
MKKASMLLTAVLLIVSMLAGCASNAGSNGGAGNNGGNNGAGTATENPGKDSEAQKPVKLKFSMWGNDAHKAMYDGLIAEFKTEYPHIDVEIINIPFADYQQKLSIMLASKTGPDVGWLAERMIPQFMDSGQLVDIASSVQGDADYKFDDVFPSTLELFTSGEKVYGIPFSTPPMLVYYNKTLFQEKGLKTPSELYAEGNWNYEQYLQAAKAITDHSKGIYGVRLIRDWKNWSDALLPIIWSHGAELFSADGKSFTLNTAEGQAALQIYNDLIFKDGAHPKPGDEITFDTGKLGMYTDRYSYVSKTREIKDFEWDIAPMPEGMNGRGTTLGYAGYSVFDTEHPEEAMAFLKFISNETSMGKTSAFFVPSRKSVLESDVFMKAAPQPSPESIQVAVLDQMSDAKIAPGHPNWQQIDVKVQTLLDYLYTQSESVEEVLKRMEAEVNPLLNK